MAVLDAAESILFDRARAKDIALMASGRDPVAEDHLAAVLAEPEEVEETPVEIADVVQMSEFLDRMNQII